MTQVSADFETGVNGNNLATGDTGSATAFNAVTTTTTATQKYDNTHVAFGNLGVKFDGGATSGAAYFTWSTALGTVTDHYGRIYLYLTATPSSQLPIIWGGQSTTRGGR